MKLWIAVRADGDPLNERVALEQACRTQNGCGCVSVTAGYSEDSRVAATKKELLSALDGEDGCWALGRFVFGRREVAHWVDADGTPCSVWVEWLAWYDGAEKK